MESIVEGSARRLFRSRITAAEIARRLERAMESQQTITVDRIIVPSFYRAYLHPEDFQAFEAIQLDLEQEMGMYLLELAQERGFTLLQHPVVDVAPNPSTPRHGVQVVAEMVAALEQSGQQSGGYAGTQVMSHGNRPAQPQTQGKTELLLRLPDGEYRFPLAGTPVMIGRGLSNDIVLDDPRVSRQHAQIWANGRRFVLADQGSTNGTYVNGMPVSGEQPLHAGDIISLGGLELEFRQY
jgi:hypothetical protein